MLTRLIPIATGASWECHPWVFHLLGPFLGTHFCPFPPWISHALPLIPHHFGGVWGPSLGIPCHFRGWNLGYPAALWGTNYCILGPCDVQSYLPSCYYIKAVLVMHQWLLVFGKHIYILLITFHLVKTTSVNHGRVPLRHVIPVISMTYQSLFPFPLGLPYNFHASVDMGWGLLGPFTEVPFHSFPSWVSIYSHLFPLFWWGRITAPNRFYCLYRACYNN